MGIGGGLQSKIRYRGMREKRKESSEGEQAISLSEDEVREGETEGGTREELRVKAEATIIHFLTLVG